MSRRKWYKDKWRNPSRVYEGGITPPDWAKDELFYLLKVRSRGILAAAFAQGAWSGHPWDEAHWNNIAIAVAKTFSLFAQAEGTVKELPPEATPILVRVQYENSSEEPARDFQFQYYGEPPWRSSHRPNVLVSAKGAAEDQPFKVSIEVSFSLPDRQDAYKQYAEFLMSELKYQLSVVPAPASLYSRPDLGTAHPMDDQVYWDVRVRFSDFLRRFLRCFRGSPQEPSPYLAFFVAPKTLFGQLSRGHIPSGLFGHYYIPDEGQLKFLKSKKIDPKVFAKDWVPFPKGVCSHVFLRGDAVPPHDLAEVIDEEYQKAMPDLAGVESSIFGNSMLMEIPVLSTGCLAFEDEPDGPELILCVTLPTAEDLNDPNIETEPSEPPASYILSLLDPLVPNSPLSYFEWQVVKETGQRMITKYTISSSLRPAEMGIIGRSEEIAEVRKRIALVADAGVTVLVLGESGTGKELVAEAIHQNGPRRTHPLICLNCAAIPKELIEDELFGHEKGAFTGASERRKGKIEAADGGVLFLDEIGDMPVDMQAKILKVLEDGTVTRLGSNTPTKVDVQFVAATNHNLPHRIEKGLFRDDLYHRLNVIDIKVPTLRERAADIPDLARHFVSVLSKHESRLDDDAAEYLMTLDYPYDGNVRELKNRFIRKALVLAGYPNILEKHHFEVCK